MAGYAAPPGTRVLAIDDDPSLLRLLTHALGSAGFHVDTAPEGRAGVAQARAAPPDLVVCDVSMPGMSGYEVLDALRADAMTADLPCVLLTALSDRESVREGMRHGADDFVCKPMRPLELVEAVSAALEKRRRLKALGQPAAAARPGEHALAGMTGRMLTQTVLFTDIRGFTALSERLPAGEVADLLSRYLNEACRPIREEGGRILKVLGDGMMALFGQDASQEARAHAGAALRAAQGILASAQAFRQWIASRYDIPGLPRFDVGVGIHTGEVMLFRLSVDDSCDLTAVGDTVNVAARLEAKSKALGWPIVASVATLQHAGAGFPVAETRTVALAGREAPVEVGRLACVAAPEAPAPQPATSAPMPHVAGYDLREKIGEGGMSSAYRARDAAGREVVLKILKGARRDDDMLWKRFFQECAILSAIRHDNIVRVYDQGFDESLAYMAMEHLGGGSLAERIRDRLWPSQALGLLAQAASALAEIHRRGIVHRDVKPGNLLLRDAGLLVLTDFGVAKWLDRSAGETLHGEVLGTPYYMAPEQAQGGRITPRADVYSLGVIFHEMLTGERPYTGESIAEILARHASAPLPRLPGALQAYQPLLEGLLAKQPEARLADGAAVLRAIGQAKKACSA